MTDQQPETVTVPKEQWEALNAKSDKLETIFNERQTKTIDREGLVKVDDVVKALGIDPKEIKNTNDAVSAISAKLNTLTEETNTLKTEAQKAREDAENTRAISNATKLAQTLNFNDVDDALRFIDVKSETLEADLKQLAESKPYLLKQAKSVGGSFAGGKVPDNTNTDIQQELKKYI